MMAVSRILAGGLAAAALVTSAPAAAQYYPGYGGYGNGNVVGQVINQVLGGGYGGYGGYGYNQQALTNQCAAAVQQRLSGGYGGYGGYGYAGGYGGGRVLGISRVEPRSGGGFTVRGVATSGRNAGYGYGYGGQSAPDLTWRCKTDYRGFITGINVDRAQSNYGYGGYNGYGYTPNNNYDYSQYGYRRY